MVKYLALLSLIAALLLVLPATAAAQGLPPSGFYGEVSAGGQSVKDGTTIEVLVDGKKAAETTTKTFQGKSVYNVDVGGDATLDGKKVEFTIGTLKAPQTGTWKSGTNVALNLAFPALPSTGDEQVPALLGLALLFGVASVAFGSLMLRRSQA